MSALAGIVNFTGAPVDGALLARMSRAGILRGPDVEGQWSDGGVGFVYRGVWPPGKVWDERQPLSCPETGLTVVLDGRVDGRSELSAACAAAGHPPRTSSDAELVLRAYQVWGERCPRYIHGDYAFAIWDPARGHLVCARDAIGVRPLYYAHGSDGSFRFATGANQLLSDPRLPRSADAVGLVDFLIDKGSMAPERTPCASVRRLPAAHTLIVNAHGIRTRQYWSLEDEMDGASATADYADACAHALQLAIRDRLRGEDPVGLLLSGGWDSGAIFALWQWMRSRGESLPPPWTTTNYWEYPEADERDDVRALLHRWPAEGAFVRIPVGGVTVGLEQHVNELGMPEIDILWPWARERWAAMRAAGIRAVLTGYAGNTVLQSSFLLPVDWLRARRIRAALAQLQIWSNELGGRPVRHLLWPHLIKPILPLLVPRLWAEGRRARRTFSTTRSGLPYFTNTANRHISELIQSREVEHRRAAAGRSLTEWSTLAAVQRDQRKLFSLPPALDLEGVVASDPYLDRRVLRVALPALIGQTSPASSRALLAAVLERTAGHRLPGNYWSIAGWANDTLKADLRADPTLFASSTLIELGIVDRDRLRHFLTEYASGMEDYSIPLFTLVSLEAWARCWLANRS